VEAHRIDEPRDREAPSAPPAPRLARLATAVFDLAAVGVAVGFIATYFPRALMLSPTTTNGGDMGSHYYPALYLKEVLLPSGRIVGWCPGNYCGFPIFQFYFWFPFLLMVLLSRAIELTVAFKLVTVLGTFLLPPCAYLGLRLGGVPFPGPALGALASLCFLFMEANSMWGGNIPSTLAGEFTFSLGVALSVLFLGTLHRTCTTGRGRPWNALLVALIGVSHGYTLLWSGLTSLVEAAATRGWWRRVWTMLVAHGLGILLMAFWLFPLLAYSPWTTAYSHVWMLSSWKEVLPPVLWPAAIVAVLTSLGVAVRAAVRREPVPRFLLKLWAGAAFGIVLYFSARTFHVVDIRFIPFFQLGLCLIAATGLGLLLGRLPMPHVWAVVGMVAIPTYVQGGFPKLELPFGVTIPRFYAGVTFIPDWIRWNYSGFEAKGTWGTFKAINDKLRGTHADPRVVYEHSMEHEPLGTVRAFENLPLFSGRSTLEGLYMQASPTAPFVFYTQSEISKEQSCPFPDYGCSRLNLDRGVQHLRMFNVSQFIVKSAVVKQAAAVHPELTREAAIGQYEIYRVRGNADRYAVPLAAKPALVLTDGWKEVAYRWFKKATGEETLPVFAESASAEERALFGAVVEGELPAEPLPRVPLGPLPELRERIDDQRITIENARPGHPLLVRVSYHPRWQATTGEKVWLAAPSFMLVFPKGERVELVFGDGPPVVAGRIASILGWAIFLVAVTPLARVARPVFVRLGATPPVAAVRGLGAWSGTWGPRVRRSLVLAGVLATTAVFAAAGAAARGGDADSTYRAGQVIYDQGKLEEALPYFQKAQRLAPLSNTAIHSTYYESIILFRLERWPAAEAAFLRLATRYPEANAAPESLYHVGICRAKVGDKAGAIHWWHELLRRYPGSTPWGGYAKDRLREAGAPEAPPA